MLVILQDIIRRGLYALFGKMSLRWRLRNVRAAEEFSTFAKAIAESDRLRARVEKAELRLRLTGIMFTLCGLTFLVLTVLYQRMDSVSRFKAILSEPLNRSFHDKWELVMLLGAILMGMTGISSWIKALRLASLQAAADKISEGESEQRPTRSKSQCPR